MEALILILGLISTVYPLEAINESLFNQNGYLVHSINDIKPRSAGTSSGINEGLRVAINDILTRSFWITDYTGEENSKCSRHHRILRERANHLETWALQILDASAKIPSGILNGNLNQFGDFDQCIASYGEFKGEVIRGKYCLANVDIRIQGNDTNEIVLDDLLHAHRIFTNDLSDPGHRIPKLETFNWGICMPDSCTNKDLEAILNQQFSHFQDKIRFKVAVDEELCYVNNSKPFTAANYIASIFFIVIIFLVIGGSLINGKINLKKSKWKEYLRCFSLKENWETLIRTESSEDDLGVLHGARFLNAIALLLSHKQMAMLFNPFMNRSYMAESFGKTWSMIGRSAIIYTDTFIMMSGLLASYSMVKEFDQKKKISFKEKVLSRYIRFTPNLLAIILFCTYIMEHLGSGPQWGLVVDRYSTLCKKYMWRNFLYMHNYFGFENMCLTHTHQLGIDMQLYIISPLFIYFLWKTPKKTMISLLALATASTILRYIVTYQKEISTLIHYGIPVERLWKTANFSYILPTHRLTAYLIGIVFGYFLRRGGKKLTFTKLQVTTGWIVGISAGLLAMFGPYHMAFKNYVYDPLDAALYNASAPILWSIFLGWASLACINGYGGFFNNFLCWKYFKIFSRISYALYLTQFPVYFYNVGIQRSVLYYKGFHSLFDVTELGIIFGASIILTLLFDLPFQKLRNLSKKSAAPKKELKTEKAEDPLPKNGVINKNSNLIRRIVQSHG